MYMPTAKGMDRAHRQNFSIQPFHVVVLLQKTEQRLSAVPNVIKMILWEEEKDTKRGGQKAWGRGGAAAKSVRDKEE